MSGFEVAGLLIGAIPLIISGLEHYSKGISTMKNMQQYECVFDNINCSFAASVLIHRDSCYALLAPLNLSENQIRALLEEQDSEKVREAWRDAELQKKLVKRLGMNCKTYLSFLDKLNRRILLLAHKLKLGPTFMPPWVLKDGTIDEKSRQKFFSSVWTRIRGGFITNKCASLLIEIDNDIRKISELTSVTLEVESLRIHRRCKLRSRSLRVMRENAQSLFDILHLRWSGPCPCQLQHRANLQLSMLQENEAHPSEEDGPTRFALLFSFEKDSRLSKPPPWFWRDIEVETSPRAQPQSGSPSVRFNIPSAPPMIASRSKAPATSIVHQPAPALKIDNLCKTLIPAGLPSFCLGFLEDQQRRHQLFLVPGPGIRNEIVDETSLSYIIHGNKKVVLGPREKCSIALFLANAVLQLHDTPWLAKSWDLQDICVLRAKSGAYFLDRPYLSLSFIQPNNNNNNTLRKNSRKHDRRLLKNEIVFALGVALLELSFSQPLSDLTTPSDLDQNGKVDLTTEYSIATRLAKDIHLRELPNYAKAVSRCVQFNFDTNVYDLTEEDFKERFYEGVVVPLKEDWEYVQK